MKIDVKKDPTVNRSVIVGITILIIVGGILVAFVGMPDLQWWEMEDLETDFGNLDQLELVASIDEQIETGGFVQAPSINHSETAAILTNKNCDSSYPDICIPAYSLDLDCDEIYYSNFA